jgi:hypothetical protein
LYIIGNYPSDILKPKQQHSHSQKDIWLNIKNKKVIKTAKRRKARKVSRRPVILSISKTQTGVSVRRVDAKRLALAPGRRRSKSGRVYTERRRNRSDRSAKKRL